MDSTHREGFPHNGTADKGSGHASSAAPIGRAAGIGYSWNSPADIGHILRSHLCLWLVPAVACTVLAAGYALLASREWRAAQALIVRPEAASVSDERLGKFSDLSEMKTLQETILEVAKSQGVLKATLEKIGPPSSRSAANWPTARDVEEFRTHIDMRPPGGAEFGKTEVFYLSVLDTHRLRASDMLAELCNQLEQRMQELRDQRAQSMVAELQRTVEMAEHDLAGRTEQLSQFEAHIGADLVELRNLNATTGGQGEVSQELQTIEAERRANDSQRRENLRLVELLKRAQDDPTQLLATPSSLLQSQPSLSRLKDSLIDAKVRVAGLIGTRSEQHPFVIAARASEKEIRDQLHQEIQGAIAGLDVTLEMNADREQSLVAKQKEARQRLSRLAESRAEYANLVVAAENHTKLVEAARKNLADARARQTSAHSASIIGRIDGVDAGIRPVGPGRVTITASGGIAGLLLGFGLVFLAGVPAPAVAGDRSSAGLRRWNEGSSLASGRRPEQFGLRPSVSLEDALREAESPIPRGNDW